MVLAAGLLFPEEVLSDLTCNGFDEDESSGCFDIAIFSGKKVSGKTGRVVISLPGGRGLLISPEVLDLCVCLLHAKRMKTQKEIFT